MSRTRRVASSARLNSGAHQGAASS